MQVYSKIRDERILCKLRKSEILRLCSINHVATELRKHQFLSVNQNLSSVHFSLAKRQLVSSNLSLAIIWQMTYNHKLPKLCSATLIGGCLVEVQPYVDLKDVACTSKFIMTIRLAF